ncbi:MAG: hypothetical protein ACE5GX_04215 [Thermoanaerobaculia bacterium]
MAQSVRTIASNCLGKSGTLSVKEDLLGVYANDNPQNRSLKQRLDLIENNPFVSIALVTIQGASPQLQRDLDNTNTVLQGECGAWLYPVDSITVKRPNLQVLNQNTCPLGVQADPTDEEDELFDLGRGFGTDLVGYYIQSGPGAGCSAYPAGRRGFWVDDGGSPWTFCHELVHVVGLNAHVTNSDNLMSTPTASITNPPPDMTNGQCFRFISDPTVESC